MRLHNGSILSGVLPDVCGVHQDILNLQLLEVGSNSDQLPISEPQHRDLLSGNLRASQSIESSNQCRI